ncbi:MAG: hypothetical protein ACJAVP_003570 [Spirosomataceae bacterium]|jgi:hypothetical protein
MRKTLLLILILIYHLGVQAQNDKLPIFFIPDTTVVYRTFPSIGIDNRLSFIDGNSVAFKGVRAGVRFGAKRHRLTFAYRWFSFADDIGLLKPRTILNPRYINQLEAFYYSLSYQHILLDKYRYAIGTTFDIGLGATYNKDIPYFENLNVFNKPDKFVPIQLGVYGEWKATRFIGLTSQVGYRWVQNYNMQPSISNLYLGLGSRLYLGSILRYVFRNRKHAANFRPESENVSTN